MSAASDPGLLAAPASVDGASSADGGSSAERRPPAEGRARITLPPPEWTAPRVTFDPALVEPPAPLDRRVDARPATEGALRAELSSAHAAQDTARERLATARLARWLASRGRGWDEALRCARGALALGEDESLRHELASWLEGLGDAAAAAEVLAPLVTAGTRDPVEAVRILLHKGVLETRAGNARAAATSFTQAARLDQGEALASELLGTLAAWATGVVTPPEAAESYVEAARRRAAARATDAQMDDLLRAFDVDPTSSVAVVALGSALIERGRPLGADEVWRAHATALRPDDEKRCRSVHARRRLQASAAGDLPRALGAALDEGLDAVFGPDLQDPMDDLLLRAGMFEPLVARLEVRAERAPRAVRGALLEEAARHLAGPLGNPDRAAAARVMAFEADPSREDTLTAIRAHATETRDATELVEALIRAVRTPEDAVAPGVRLSAAEALAVIADEALDDPTLSSWALESAGAPGAAEDAGRAAVLAAAREERDRLREWLETVEGEERVAVLRSLAVLLRSRPDDGVLDGKVLAELVERASTERRWYVEANRLALRRRDFAEIMRLARAVRERGGPLQDVIDAAVVESVARRALGDFAGANETTRGLVRKAPDDPRALAAAWVNASLAGDRETRCAAIEHLAKFTGAAVRAVLCTVAAEARGVMGDREASRKLAERACQTDPSSARAVGTLADAAHGAHDRAAVSALERGIHFLFARSSWCRSLAAALDSMGEASYAVGWTQRLVALRPSDRKAMAALLERVARTRDGARLAEALMWVLARPQPTSAVVDLVVAPLRDLVAIDPGRAALVARRALDAFGSKLSGLRDAILAAADAAGDSALACAALERAVVAEDGVGRSALLSALRERQQRAGDMDGEARTLLAIAHHAPEASTSPALEALGHVVLSPDGELARLEAVAHLATSADPRTPDNQTAAIQAWRALGAAQWDLAGDREGAERSLWRAARLDPQQGTRALVFDLAALGGVVHALDSIERHVAAEASDVRAAVVALHASQVALALDEPSRSLDLAVTALSRNPSLSEALEIAEVAATGARREAELTRVYDELTLRALGRFGRRALNYRAARFFEHQADSGLALKHAARAFEAVPSEGAALALLVRAAQRAGDRAQAVEALVRVAECADDAAARFAWLMRASDAAGVDEQGLALRVDVLLRALAVTGDPRAAVALEQVAGDLVHCAPDERASLELRLRRASTAAMAKAAGSGGARLAIAFARMALDIFDDAAWGGEAIGMALDADGDVEDFDTLIPHAFELTQGGGAEPLFARVVRPYANVGVAAYRLLARVAELRGESGRAADLWSRAAARDPDDASLVRVADGAVARFGGEEQQARLRKAVPEDERARMYRAHARERLQEKATEEALKALERAAELSVGDDRVAVERDLAVAYEASGRAERTEERLLVEARSQDAVASVRAQRWAEVAQRREARRDVGGAVEAMLEATMLDATSSDLWLGLARASEAAGRNDLVVVAFREATDRLTDESQATARKALARALEAQDEFREAELVWRQVYEANPDDDEADHAVEALHGALRDYEGLAAHLQRRIVRLAQVDAGRASLRAVRLRRAAILEQRLGRTRDACAELSLVLEESPDNTSALSYLADLHERLGEVSKAAPMWRRLALLSRDSAAQLELTLRAGRAALASSDYAGALVCAKEAIAGDPDRREALDLRVSAAHGLRDDVELGEALEAVAACSVDDPRMCSDALMEASHAAMRAGRERLALNRARRAAEAAPIRPAPVVLARMLEYRVRGAGTADEARATIAAIDQVSQEPSSEEAAILAFVRAEALAAIPDAGSGLAALRDCEAVHGLHALLSLGIAERLLTVGDFEGALAGFQAALAGDLCAVRDRGRVALAAAETAIRAGSPDAALTLFQDAAGSVGLRTTALLRAAQLVLQRGDISRARGILGELATSTVGDDQARVLAELARLERESADSAERVHAAETFERAVAAASAGGPLAAELAMERDALARPASQPWVMGSLSAPSYAQAGPSSLSVPVLAGIALAAPAEVGEREPAPGGAGAVSFESVIAAPVEVLPEPTVPAVEATGPTPAPAPLVEGPFEVEPPADATPPAATSPPSQVVVSPADGRVAPPATPELPRTVEDLRRMVEAGGKPEEISLARVALARAYLDQGARDAAQSCLETGLEGGGVAEGEMLASLLESAGRRAEVVRVRRSLVALRPGESQLIDALGAAAAADANAPYAQAIEHVARVVDAASTPASPPPLGAQVALPGFLAFLTRAAADRAAQALALVWEDGHSVWSKEASGVLQGTQSISAVGGPAVALYERAIALLSLPRVPIFVRPSSEAPTARVALMWPAAGVVTGRVDEDTAAVRLTVGRALAVALPANALPLGLVDANARYAFRAVMGAFGPPESSRSMDRESGRLAEALWHVLPPRTQRKLQAMLTTVQLDDFEAVPARSLRCVERVGLFLAGDFEASVRSVLGERSRASGGPPPDLRQIDWCAVCRDDPTIRDLFFFALSPEYAEARWHAPSSESRRASSRPDAP